MPLWSTILSYLFQAMLLKVPVIARNVSGNAAVISHDQTGLLYDTPQVITDIQIILCFNINAMKINSMMKMHWWRHETVPLIVSFCSYQDFLQCASSLLSDDKLHERISREALSYVTSTHSEQTEREHYLNLVHQTLNGSQTQA